MTLRRPGRETDLEIRDFINSYSPSMCLAKWLNATIWLGSGMTTSCHHPLPHKVPVEDVIANPKALHNTLTKKEERRQMQCGERPSGCNYCWTVEDLNKDAISDRVYKTVIYDDSSVDLAFNTAHTEDVNLQTLEISFDRTCNFACSYCNPAFSTSWVKDINTNGPYIDLVSDGRNHYTHPHESSQLYGFNEPNPYVEAFFKWWETDLHKTLKELRVTGGEPLTSADTWKLLDWFMTNKTDMKFALNSNLGVKEELIDKLIAVTHRIDHFHLYTSCESMGRQAEYIRDGLVWDTWKSNVETILREGKLEGFHMMCTVNALCLQGLPDFLDQCLDWKAEFGKDFPTFTLNILRFPSFQSPLILPEDLRDYFSYRLRRWLETNGNSVLLHQMEVNQIQRLIDYLDVAKTPHPAAAEINTLRQDFRKFYKQYDDRRNKNFRRTFPLFKDV